MSNGPTGSVEVARRATDGLESAWRRAPSPPSRNSQGQVYGAGEDQPGTVRPGFE